MMFNVYRCVNDYDEVFRHWVASFENQDKAEAFADAEERSDVNGVFYTVEIE